MSSNKKPNGNSKNQKPVQGTKKSPNKEKSSSQQSRKSSKRRTPENGDSLKTLSSISSQADQDMSGSSDERPLIPLEKNQQVYCFLNKCFRVFRYDSLNNHRLLYHPKRNDISKHVKRNFVDIDNPKTFNKGREPADINRRKEKLRYKTQSSLEKLQRQASLNAPSPQTARNLQSEMGSIASLAIEQTPGSRRIASLTPGFGEAAAKKPLPQRAIKNNNPARKYSEEVKDPYVGLPQGPQAKPFEADSESESEKDPPKVKKIVKVKAMPYKESERKPAVPLNKVFSSQSKLKGMNTPIKPSSLDQVKSTLVAAMNQVEGKHAKSSETALILKPPSGPSVLKEPTKEKDQNELICVDDDSCGWENPLHKEGTSKNPFDVEAKAKAGQLSEFDKYNQKKLHDDIAKLIQNYAKKGADDQSEGEDLEACTTCRSPISHSKISFRFLHLMKEFFDSMTLQRHKDISDKLEQNLSSVEVLTSIIQEELDFRRQKRQEKQEFYQNLQQLTRQVEMDIKQVKAESHRRELTYLNTLNYFGEVCHHFVKKEDQLVKEKLYFVDRPHKRDILMNFGHTIASQDLDGLLREIDRLSKGETPMTNDQLALFNRIKTKLQPALQKIQSLKVKYREQFPPPREDYSISDDPLRLPEEENLLEEVVEEQDREDEPDEYVESSYSQESEIEDESYCYIRDLPQASFDALAKQEQERDFLEQQPRESQELREKEADERRSTSPILLEKDLLDVKMSDQKVDSLLKEEANRDVPSLSKSQTSEVVGQDEPAKESSPSERCSSKQGQMVTSIHEVEMANTTLSPSKETEVNQATTSENLQVPNLSESKNEHQGPEDQGVEIMEIVRSDVQHLQRDEVQIKIEDLSKTRFNNLHNGERNQIVAESEMQLIEVKDDENDCGIRESQSEKGASPQKIFNIQRKTKKTLSKEKIDKARQSAPSLRRVQDRLSQDGHPFVVSLYSGLKGFICGDDQWIGEESLVEDLMYDLTYKEDSIQELFKFATDLFSAQEFDKSNQPENMAKLISSIEEKNFQFMIHVNKFELYLLESILLTIEVFRMSLQKAKTYTLCLPTLIHTYTSQLFKREFQFMAQKRGLKLPIPKYLAMYHFGQQNKFAFLLSGIKSYSSLEEIIKRDEIFYDKILKAKICKAIIEALAKCHNADIFHNNLSPKNIFIMITSESKVFAKILDWKFFSTSQIQTFSHFTSNSPLIAKYFRMKIGALSQSNYVGSIIVPTHHSLDIYALTILICMLCDNRFMYMREVYFNKNEFPLPDDLDKIIQRFNSSQKIFCHKTLKQSISSLSKDFYQMVSSEMLTCFIDELKLFFKKEASLD